MFVPLAHYRPEKWLYNRRTNFPSMEWENYPGFQCTYVHWLLIAISPSHLNNNWTPYHERLEIFIFFWKSFFCFIWTNISALSSSSMQILDLSLNITFIQLFTSHDYFSLTHFNLIFFRLCKSWFLFGFSLCKSHFIQPISYTSVSNIDFCFNPLIFLFVLLYIFYFYDFRVWNFYPDAFRVFRDLPICFSFSTSELLLYLHQILVLETYLLIGILF